jgi:class 3 adenylate cyclase/YHS domain-containing protein
MTTLTGAAIGAIVFSGMAQALSARELSARSSEPTERINAWCDAGLIGDKTSRLFAPEDLQRIRLIQFLLRHGFALEAIVQANKEAGIIESHVELLASDGQSETYSVEEAAAKIGWGIETVCRFLDAAGLAEKSSCLAEEDVRALRALKLGEEAGLPEAALLQLARVYSDALGRVAEAEVRLFHFHVHEPLKARGLSARELREATADARHHASSLIEPSLLYFHRRGMERAMREDALLHIQEDVQRLGLLGQVHAAVVFVDLASFTPMTEVMGDHAAADVLDRYAHLVRDAVAHHDGRVVKQIGDAFMLLFPRADDALACALAIEARSATEPQFTAVRSGLHCGPVLYREGDYLGTTVNVAARLVSEAQRHQVLLTAALRQDASALPGVDFVALGSRPLKGLAEPLEVFEAVPSRRTDLHERLLDPVCGMELQRGEVAARLSLADGERGFCSQDCLRRFVAAPEKYEPPGR